MNNHTPEEIELTMAIVIYLESLDGIYFSANGVIDILKDKRYDDLFFFDDNDELNTKDLGLMNKFIKEIHNLEIEREFKKLSEEGICEQGVDKENNIRYFPCKITKKELFELVYKNLDKK